MSKFLKLSLLFGLFLFVLTLASSTYAISDNSSDMAQEKMEQRQIKTQELKNTTKNSGGVESKKEKVMALKEDKASAAAIKKAVKLSEARLKICEVREKNIANRFRTLLTLGTNTQKGKEKIVERVDAFYNNTLVPEGYTLPNYLALKEDIETKQAAVAEILESAQESGSEFSCDSDDPKAQTDEFKTNIQSLIAANRAYKASVKTFVVAVRDLAKKAKAENASPTPEVSPAVTSAVSPVVSPVISPEVTEAP